jgi:glycerophosphoryl diester phosphodiesterase
MRIEVAAHRGNQALYPENTIPAFRSACEIGVDMIELDLHMTKDGEIVIAHDSDFMRTADYPGKIHEMTLSEIKRIDVGKKRGPEFAGYTVPTLREFLDLMKEIGQQMTFNFEFKDYIHVLGSEFACKSADRAIALIDEYGFWDRSFANSFDGGLLEYIEKKYDGRFRLHGFYPYEIIGNSKARLYCVCLLNRHLVDGKWVRSTSPVNPVEDFRRVKADGIHPWVGQNVRTETDVLCAVERGAELFTSDEPAALIELLKKHGLR